jgi:hypothetical protein
VQSEGTEPGAFETAWRWFYRAVLGVGAVFLALSLLLVWGMSRPLVFLDSNGFVAAEDAPPDVTMCGTFPDSATDIQYVGASVGMGGRFRAYRFSGSVDELHAHAVAEFAGHWDKLTPVRSDVDESPFTAQDVGFWEDAYVGGLDWMLSPAGARGALYQSADGSSSHCPIVFVDETNGVLYFVMTD